MSWYNEQRVSQPGSVILNAFVAQQQAARQAKTGKRSYAGAAVNRLTSDWTALQTSADSEILTSLRLLRSRSRQMVRDNAHARNAVRIVQNNVVGQGIGLQATVANARGALQEKTNSAIETAWLKWTEKTTCHTAGLLALPEMLRLAAGQLVEAGEVLIRKVRKQMGGGQIPLALEVIEADRLMDQWQTAVNPETGNAIRMGVESDTWGRPVAYWLWPTHPGDYQFKTFIPSKFLRIPADEIIHLYIIERWPQTRGVPWFHAVLRRMNDMAGYTEAEIVAARASAAIVGFIKSPEAEPGDEAEGDDAITTFEPGTIKSLLPGEEFQGFNPTRPNSALEPFMRYMLREMAAGVGTSYESLSRDYSQSNYSSSRLALLDDRDLWRVLQGWMIRSLLVDVYREWLDAAVLCGAVPIADYYSNREKYQSCRFKPRGWSWIDPTKEVNAYRLAVRAGFMTVDDVISITGGGVDSEDVFKARRQELDLMGELELVFDTDPAQVNDKGQVQAATPENAADSDPNESPSQEMDEADPEQGSAADDVAADQTTGDQ
ncbi:MAG: phage portal protein [Formivibrio sp.]|nr:phage portal protein [Formivibrio sp.]